MARTGTSNRHRDRAAEEPGGGWACVSAWPGLSVGGPAGSPRAVLALPGSPAVLRGGLPVRPAFRLSALGRSGRGSAGRRGAAVGLLLAILGCAASEPPPAAASRPNLLFVITDDQRFDMIGSVNPAVHTPHMDRLAARGVRFEQAFVTTPICAASRASLLTGLYERTHAFTFGTPPLRRDLVDSSYPALLRSAGYRTGHVGKFGVELDPGAHEAMFDVFRPLSAPYLAEREDGAVRHLTDVTADEAIAFLRGAGTERPFALTLSFNAPHAEDDNPRQYIWPEAVDHLYEDVEIPPPPLSEPEFFESLPEFLREPSLNRIRWHWRFDTPEKARRMTKGYLRMISGVDAALGRVLEELESLDLDESTVVVLMSDNGYFLGERGYAGKWLPYELSIRVPLVVFDPRPGTAAAGARPGPLVLNVDVAPTLLDLAGVDVPPAMQGRSLVPILAGDEPAGWREDFFVEHLFDHPAIPKHEGVRGERYKYARYFEQDPLYEELFDLVEDPLETRNLAGEADHAERLQALRDRCDALRDRYGGPWVRPPSGEGR